MPFAHDRSGVEKSLLTPRPEPRVLTLELDVLSDRFQRHRGLGGLYLQRAARKRNVHHCHATRLQAQLITSV